MVLLVGPFVAVVGLVAIVFVMRRKSVEKRSMYSARRSQIEHKVRAARQRTLAPHGHAEKPPEPAPVATSPPAPQATWAKPAAPTVTYQPSAFQPPPEAPAPASPEAPTSAPPEPAASPWDMGATAAPAPPYEAPPEPFQPAPEPMPAPPPYEQQWSPGPAPAEPAAPVAPEPVSAAAGGGAGWSVVTDQKGGAEPDAGRKGEATAPASGSSWQLASGEAPSADMAEGEVKRSSGSLVAIAQYAILVVGLVMVLIGVLVMVANSHVT